MFCTVHPHVPLVNAKVPPSVVFLWRNDRMTGHKSSTICSHPCPDDTQKSKRGENHNIIINMVMETTIKSQFIRDLL